MLNYINNNFKRSINVANQEQKTLDHVAPQKFAVFAPQIRNADYIRQRMAFKAKLAKRIRHKRRIHRYKSFRDVTRWRNI